MRLPNAFPVPRPKRWTDQRPRMGPKILANRVVHALGRIVDQQDATLDASTEQLARLEAEDRAKRERDRAARRRVP